MTGLITEDQQQQQQGDGESNQNQGLADGEVVRPEGLDESYWDADSKAPLLDKLIPDFNELRNFKNDREAAEAALPKDADGYEIALPDDFELPEGMEYELDPEDPMIPVVKQFAIDNHLSTDAVKQLVGMRAQLQIAEEQALAEAGEAEKAKLGASADSRLKALSTFMTAKLGAEDAKALLPNIYTAKQVQAFEKLMNMAKGANGGGYNGNGRESNEGAAELSDEEWEKMSPSDRINWSRKNAQQQHA